MAPYQEALLARGLRLCKGVDTQKWLSRMGEGGDDHLPGKSPGSCQANANIPGLQDNWDQYH